MNRSYLMLLALGAVLSACAATLTIDGYEATYDDAPADYERHPHYDYRGTHVYEINGRYYRKYNNRWVVYRSRPHNLQGGGHAHPGGPGGPGGPGHGDHDHNHH